MKAGGVRRGWDLGSQTYNQIHFHRIELQSPFPQLGDRLHFVCSGMSIQQPTGDKGLCTFHL